MATIGLLLAPPHLTDEALLASTRLLAKRLRTALMVTDTLTDLPQGAVDLILWMPERFDAAVLRQVQHVCARVILLIHRKDRTELIGHLPARQPPPDGLVTVVAPFYDVDESCLYILGKFGWSPQDDSESAGGS